MAEQLTRLQDNSEREGWKCIEEIRTALQKQLDDGQLEQQQFSMELNALHEALTGKAERKAVVELQDDGIIVDEGLVLLGEVVESLQVKYGTIEETLTAFREQLEYGQLEQQRSVLAPDKTSAGWSERILQLPSGWMGGMP